jgi:uncharacterized protein
MAVRAKISFITHAVPDLDQSVVFYPDGLGRQTEGVVGQKFHYEVTGADGTIAFFALEPGLTLGLYERANLAEDACLLPGPSSSTEFSLGIPAGSRAEVDELLRQAEAVDVAQLVGEVAVPVLVPPGNDADLLDQREGRLRRRVHRAEPAHRGEHGRRRPLVGTGRQIDQDKPLDARRLELRADHGDGRAAGLADDRKRRRPDGVRDT